MATVSWLQRGSVSASCVEAKTSSTQQTCHPVTLHIGGRRPVHCKLYILSVRCRVQDDKKYSVILEVIKNDALRQIEKERSEHCCAIVRPSVRLSVSINVERSAKGFERTFSLS